MNVSAVKTAVWYVVGLATVVFFVVLLTIIFSFLGAFFCAALAGMMLGSVKLPRWHIASLSVIFPAVLFTILRTGGAELLMKQVALLSVLCLATFWLTYLLVQVVVWFERKGHPATTPVPVVLAGAQAGNQPSAEQDGSAGVQTSPAVVPVRGLDELNLQVLQGQWSCATTNGNSHREQKLMEITRDKLVLTVSDSTGKIRFLGKGEVALSKPQVVRLSSAGGTIREPADDTLVSI